MSAPTKPRGGSESELTKLKILWRDSLAEDARYYWQELFVSKTTQAQIRAEILTKLKINLRFDKQLTAFRDWEQEQRFRELEAERQADDELRLKAQFGADWTLDQIREEVLKRSYARAIQEGDWAAGRKTIVQDLNVKKVSLDERKLKLLEAKAAQADKAKGILENRELSEAEKKSRMHELFGLA